MFRTNLFLLPLLVAVILSLSLGLYRGRARNYLDPHHPGFSGSFSSSGPAPETPITVVSYNIRYGLKLPEAVQDLERGPLQNADLLLLQEMDEAGTAQLAEQLSFNYIYFPSAVHPRSGRNFGNAILSKWPIAAAEKLLLPHHSWLSGIARTAAKATITIGPQIVQVYSVHNEYFLASQEQRQDQLNAILDDIDPEAELVILGGDFNTFGANGVGEFTLRMAEAGLERTHPGYDPTVAKLFVKATTDHIFVKGFAVQAAGTETEINGSDHYPIWAQLNR
jgi:endonuclease/exonuclease/phosphatase family metal-dependent hydrolase